MSNLPEVFPGFRNEYSFARIQGDPKYHVIAPDRERMFGGSHFTSISRAGIRWCVKTMCGIKVDGNAPAMGITYVEPFDSICPGCRAWIADRIIRQDFR